jgi:hypothetical protein
MVPAPGARLSLEPARLPALTSEFARRIATLCEAIAYSSGLAALVGGAMTFAVARALASPSAPREAALVACGAFVIYNVDRLRDIARDGASSPARSRFVLRHRPWLLAATSLAGIALGALLVTAPLASLALCLAIGAIGLLHRRLKQDAAFKIAYVAAAWSAACVGLPGLARSGTGGAVGSGTGGEGVAAAEAALVALLAWSFVFIGSGVIANLIASNLRDGKRIASGCSPEAAIRLARGIAIAGCSAAAGAPESVAPLAAIPAAEALALCSFRSSERFGHLAVDGALLVGALIAIGLAGG